MTNYYVNKNAQSTGEHEVHKDGCSFMPSEWIYLGDFSTCKEAIKEARKHYSDVDGCYFCNPECHTR